MLKVLAIGNSYSQDAIAYLHDLAHSSGIEVLAANLFNSGCPLQRHWEHVLGNSSQYLYELNGKGTGEMISIEAALAREKWDYVTFQQASRDSGLLDSYYPYIKNLSDYVTKHAPAAEQLIHQTWAYELDNTEEGFGIYHHNQAEMHRALTEAYKAAAKSLGLRLIPSGQVIQELRRTPAFDYANGGPSLQRDGSHLSLSYGRYAVAGTWYECIAKGNILENTYIPPSESGMIDMAKIDTIKRCIHDVVKRSSKGVMLTEI
ncbi:MAG: hypothetical protein K0R57_1463 [Paenibacillaceae bacterium]|jgi:hypothetical protein|nr:hypothetical protein [Paenibacillaceae bacterium]